MLNSHSFTLVTTLAFPICCPHFEANTTMCHAYSASTSALSCDISLPAKFFLFPCRRLDSFVTQFIILISSRLIVDVCGEKGFWGNSAAGTDNKSFENHYSYYFCAHFLSTPCLVPENQQYVPDLR